ncbi:MAG: thioredoxin-disulfide reductase [Nitrospiraceae bacterium]|nr:MAG: thioredoxin-disulfide reductase [Nitrospiraceae bacterium]
MKEIIEAIELLTMEKEILTEDVKNSLKKTFAGLRDPVTVEVFTQIGVNDVFNEAAVDLLKIISQLTDKIKVGFYSVKDEHAKKRKALRSPTILLEPDRYSIRYTGAPAGEEASSFIISLLMLSTGKSLLSDGSKKRLDRLKEKREVRIFVSPTCPYCPQQVLYAVSSAIEKKDLIFVEMIEIYENADLAEKYAAMSVPRTFLGETLLSAGLQPEENFIESLVQGKTVEYIMPEDRKDLKDYDIVVIGGGPAGLTAAIYAERSGLKSIIFEKANIGGQITITPVVENYPGFSRIAGKTLVEMMAKQTMEYSPVLQGVGVTDIKKKDSGFEVSTTAGNYKARAVIIAAGAATRKLNVPGEDTFAGRGVSYCATCDGYIFKDGKNVIVVGGGNSALTDALYLDSLGAHVTIVHRRESFRAEERLQQSVFQRNMPVITNAVVLEIQGKKVVEKVILVNLKTGEKKILAVQGVFIAIGYEPDNELAKKLGVELGDEGYIKVDEHMKTSMPLVYAAGDITGGVKQIVTAVSQGAIAALAVFEDLSSPYWKKGM